MKINLYDPKTGEMHRVHHLNVEGWIDNGFLTSPPDLNPIATKQPEPIAPKKKEKSTPVEPE